jgi:hypothetical protein
MCFPELERCGCCHTWISEGGQCGSGYNTMFGCAEGLTCQQGCIGPGVCAKDDYHRGRLGESCHLRSCHYSRE